MKQFLVVIMHLALAFITKAQSFTPFDESSSVKFEIRNFGFKVTGSFKGLKGTILFDPNEPGKSAFDVTVDASSVNTGISMRDDHLRSESYFDVKNYPRIHFVSTRVTASDKEGTLFVFGKLTIKNTTKEISFPFTARPRDEGFVFNGEFRINRRDFHVGGSGTVSNELLVNLEVIAKK
jgi:polyisoprenoid-binding protein YceI